MEPKIIIYETFGNEIITLSEGAAVIYPYKEGIADLIDGMIENVSPVISDISIRKKKLFGIDADIRAYYLMENIARGKSNFIFLKKGRAYFSNYSGVADFYNLDEDAFKKIKGIYSTGLKKVFKTEEIKGIKLDRILEAIPYLNKVI